ncbi:MAG: hypothetical protein GY751_11070 [Bacteroidetes bacterium]|nr:hypothetical protein [Bacteroidota bacterium]
MSDLVTERVIAISTYTAILPITVDYRLFAHMCPILTSSSSQYHISLARYTGFSRGSNPNNKNCFPNCGDFTVIQQANDTENKISIKISASKNRGTNLHITGCRTYDDVESVGLWFIGIIERLNSICLIVKNEDRSIFGDLKEKVRTSNSLIDILDKVSNKIASCIIRIVYQDDHAKITDNIDTIELMIYDENRSIIKVGKSASNTRIKKSNVNFVLWLTHYTFKIKLINGYDDLTRFKNFLIRKGYQNVHYEPLISNSLKFIQTNSLQTKNSHISKNGDVKMWSNSESNSDDMYYELICLIEEFAES